MSNRLETLIHLAPANDNVVVLHRAFYEFTGSMETALMLSQLLYWTPRSRNDGWIAKNDQDFAYELCTTKYQIAQSRKVLVDMGILETKIKKFNGTPMMHYRLTEALADQWDQFLETRRHQDEPTTRSGSKNELSETRRSLDYLKSKSSRSGSSESLTETTTETTTENNNKNKRFSQNATSQNFGFVARLYESEIGILTPIVADEIEDALREYPLEWFQPAIRLAVTAQARNWRYVRAVLASWKQHGFGWKPPQKTKGGNGNGRADYELDLHLENEWLEP